MVPEQPEPGNVIVSGNHKRPKPTRGELRTVEVSLVVRARDASRIQEQLVRLVADCGCMPLGAEARELTDQEWERVE